VEHGNFKEDTATFLCRSVKEVVDKAEELGLKFPIIRTRERRGV
jgi:hypothetical protein